MNSFFTISLLLFLCTPLNAIASGDPHHLAVIVDTSGSMSSMDEPRYATQTSKILSDLIMDTRDTFSVLKLGGSGCTATVMPSLVTNLSSSNHTAFKQAVDSQLASYTGGNDFSAPIGTAIDLLQPFKHQNRMILFIADSGGLDCDSDSGARLDRFRSQGGVVASINIGGNAGSFHTTSGFSYNAENSEKMIKAVAKIYQRFLGFKHIQTGSVATEIRVTIEPLVEDAFLVVAVDGAIASINVPANNPKAKKIETNFRSGGSTIGGDSRLRAYRIVRLHRPSAGEWVFNVPGLRNNAGWMLLQDIRLGARLLGSSIITRGVPTDLELELYDLATGKPVIDPELLVGLDLKMRVNGREIPFRDLGGDGDRKAGDGIFTGKVKLDRLGDQLLSIHLDSKTMDKRFQQKIEVREANYTIDVLTQDVATADQAIKVVAKLNAVGDRSMLTPVKEIIVKGEGGILLHLRDDGKDGDIQAADQRFSGTWVAKKLGRIILQYHPVTKTLAIDGRRAIEVRGYLDFAPPSPLRLGEIACNSEKNARLDISQSKLRGEFKLSISSDFKAERSVIEINIGHGWVALDRQGVNTVISDESALYWPIRVRVGGCPEVISADTPLHIQFQATGINGNVSNTIIPLSLDIQGEFWLKCWWPYIASVLAAFALFILIYGYISPSRFSSRIGVMISSEENTSDEGHFHSIHATKGSGIGCYQDAAVYVCQEYRLSGKRSDAIVKLRAQGKKVRIQATSGTHVWRRNADGDWEELGSSEKPLYFGDIYRNDSASLFFEVRNG